MEVKGMKDPYRNPNKKTREFKVNQELELMRRFQREAIFYIKVIMWLAVGSGAIVFGIFIRLLLFS